MVTSNSADKVVEADDKVAAQESKNSNQINAETKTSNRKQSTLSNQSKKENRAGCLRRTRKKNYYRDENPYSLVCRDRYRESKKRYEDQFQHEIHQTMEQLGSACEAVRFRHIVSITTLWPPMHTAKEIMMTSELFKLEPKQRIRLDKIMMSNY